MVHLSRFTHTMPFLQHEGDALTNSFLLPLVKYMANVVNDHSYWHSSENVKMFPRYCFQTKEVVSMT